MEDVEVDHASEALAAFDSYEAYLSSFVTAVDRRFLQSEELARQLIEVGINPRTNLLSQEDFCRLKERAERRRAQSNYRVVRPACGDFPPKVIAAEPFFAALAAREEQLLDERLSTVLFLRAVLQVKDKQVETSAYIDLADRLTHENFADYYSGRRLLLPKPTDLSYYNWLTNRCQFNESASFRPVTDPTQPLSFLHRKSRKTLELKEGVKVDSGINAYRQAIFYDHQTLRH